jgi:hypothetical protein
MDIGERAYFLDERLYPLGAALCFLFHDPILPVAGCGTKTLLCAYVTITSPPMITKPS